MNKTFVVIIVLITVIQTSGFSQRKKERLRARVETVAVDSLEYSLIIMDPGFESWLATRPPKNFYSKQYYEQKNLLYVSEWNHRYRTSQNNSYETYIDYNANIDYGLDLNYKLFYYFQFFEETNNVKLYPSGRMIF